MVDQKTAAAEYEVTAAREIMGAHRAMGETVTMTPAQAKYYLPPYGSGLKELDIRAEIVGSLDDPLVVNSREHATGSPGASEA